MEYTWPGLGFHPEAATVQKDNLGSLINSTLAGMPGTTGTAWVNGLGVKIGTEAPSLPSFKLLCIATGRVEPACLSQESGQD